MYQRLLESYLTPADRYDEMRDPDGRLRPHWQSLIEQLVNVTPETLRRRVRQARDAMVADGVTYNIYADPQGANRSSELDVLPQIISADEWTTLSAAVAQRAKLLNAVLADVYGPQTLLSEGLLPTALVYGQHGYLWPCREIRPALGIHLHLYAVDLVRSPDGQWRVMADCTQCPSGAGYALQNRQIMADALADPLRAMHVQSLLTYFHTLHDSLTQLAPANGAAPLVVLLTPGPYNATYPEHAFLAHTLGFPLVEGNDLTVRGDIVYMRTLNGLRQVHAIMRRLDDDYCDPLELRADSALGIPGLVQAARLGNVLIANTLGSGMLEAGALHGFLPAISQHLLGQPLALPALTSWWCGEPSALAYTLAHLDQLVILPAFPALRMAPIVGHGLHYQARQKLIQMLQSHPHAYIAREPVRRSQAPVLSRSGEYKLMSRAVSLRVFAVAGADGNYCVMPGGLTRIAPREYKAPRKEGGSPQPGAGSKDVWVLAASAPEAAVADAHGTATAIHATRFDAPLRTCDVIQGAVDVSSHAAENLFWMGRYAERCDNLAHLLRATLQRSLDVQNDSREALSAAIDMCGRLGIALPALLNGAAASGQNAAGSAIPLIQQRLINAVVDPHAAVSIAAGLRQLHHCGYQVREYLSLDNWHALNRLPSLITEGAANPGGAMNVLKNVIQACAELAGHALDDMTRDDGWHLLMLGRHIERMTHLATLFGQLLQLAPSRQNSALQWLLEATSNSVTYRVRYQRAPEWLPVLQLLIFDASNPHAIAYQLQMLERYLAGSVQQLATPSIHTPTHLLERLQRIALEDLSHDSLFFPQASLGLTQWMQDVITAGFSLSDDLARQFFTPLNAPVSQGV